MKFMYLGEGSTTIFGHTFKAGEAVEVTDERAIGKLKNSALFAHNEEAAPVAPAQKVEEPAKRRGRQPNVQN
jgi:hypothetical protein